MRRKARLRRAAENTGNIRDKGAVRLCANHRTTKTHLRSGHCC